MRLPGLATIAYQHETSRCGDPHLHTHVIVPNRQARADGQLVSIDGTSLYHEARAAGVVYQATLRRELHQSMGFEWAPVDPSTGMAELAGCGTSEMADALNQRLHHDTVDAGAPTVTGARGHRIAVGDLIISRRNDTTIELRNTMTPPRSRTRCAMATAGGSPPSTPTTTASPPAACTTTPFAVFDGDYVREHITHGYAVTVHSAQGVTADTTHAVFGEKTTRSMLYVAMTRGRETNGAYIYQTATEQEYGLDPLPGSHVMCRGTAAHAGRLAAPLSPTTISRSPHTRSLLNTQRRTAWTRAPHPRPPRSDGPAPADNLQSWQADAQSFTRAMTTERAPQQPQPRPQSRRRNRAVVTLR